MIDLRFRPLTRWIGEKTDPWKRKKPNFSAQYSRTLDDLERDLAHLRAKNATVEAGFREDQIRNDGWPYSNAAPREPGVILSFDSKHGSLALPCDYFMHWQQNLRAIGLHLEHLRLATAYGVGQKGEQYAGWKALPAPGGENSLASFAKLIGDLSGWEASAIMGDWDIYRAAYRQAAKKAHPDVNADGGMLWNKVQEAARILDQHFKGKTAVSA